MFALVVNYPYYPDVCAIFCHGDKYKQLNFSPKFVKIIDIGLWTYKPVR